MSTSSGSGLELGFGLEGWSLSAGAIIVGCAFGARESMSCGRMPWDAQRYVQEKS